MTDAQQAELGRALARELLRSYQFFNANHFGGALKTPALALVEVSSFWARWLPATRTIEVSRRLIEEQPWTVVVEVLKHEMAHQYVHEVLRADETPHGPAFREVCARLGIDPASAGLPTADSTPQSPETERVLARVQKLLALAQSDNQHEAESAAAAAQKLMLKHNLSEVEARNEPAYGFRQLGRITGRTQEWERRLGNLLGDHFFVDVIWVPAVRHDDAQRGYVLEVIGSEANLAMAEYVHAFVTRAAEQLWSAHRRVHGIRGNADRRAFLSGVIAGFADKLSTQQKRHRAEGLVWVPDASRDRYARQRHPHVRSVSHRGARQGQAFGHGREAGRELVLHRGVSRGQSGEVRRLRA